MLRWFLVIVVAVAGATWFWQDELWPSSDDGPSSVLLERPAGAGPPMQAAQGQPGAGSEPAESVVAEASQSPVEAEPGRQSLAVVLLEAQNLASSGRQGDAGELLRLRLRQPGPPLEMGRLAWVLAGWTKDGGERRSLIAQAIQAGAIAGPEYARAGEMLVVMNRTPRTGLLDSIGTELYEVRSGDSLWKICTKTLKTADGGRHEPGLLRLLNGLSSDSLTVGQRLLIPMAPLMIQIDRAGHGLVAWLDDVPVLAYEVGLGREERTPSGEFMVQVKQKNPTWYKNGKAIPFGEPENILGTRWMGFENQPGVNGYGIHG
ncbi:MAG: hypothetical protein ACI9EF_003413, partial [Pseudohongiellaceae bacterium]